MEPSTTMDDTNTKRETRIRKILENSENRLHMITSRRSQDGTKDTLNEMNARREARRCKILENSESRLRKIGARYNLSETDADNKSFVGNDSLESNLKLCTLRNGICNSENDRNLQHYTEFNEDEQEKFNTKFNDDKYDGQDEKVLNNTNDKRTCSLEEVFDKKSMSYTYLSYRVNLIVLAAIVNILLVLKLDDLFGKTVLTPYLLLMVMGRWHNFKKLREAKGSSFINAVSTVIFSKIRPNLICKLEALYILCNIVIYDFCLYMFSFILIRYACTICYYYYHVLMYA